MYTEAGEENFYLGDYVNVYINKSGSTELKYGYQISGIKYTTSNKSVVTVDKKTSRIKPLKVGSAKVTAKYKGTTLTYNIKVLKKGAMDNLRENLGSNYTTNNEVAAAFLKVCDGVNITTSNRYSVLSALRTYKKDLDTSAVNVSTTIAGEDFSFNRTYGGVGYVSFSTGNGKKYTNDYYIYDAELQHANTYGASYGGVIYNYGNSMNPYSTRSAKCFKISNVSGKGKTVTLNLKKNISADQIFGVKWWDTNSVRNIKVNASAKTVKIPFRVYDINTNKYIAGTASITQGKKKIDVSLKKKLTKGHKYQLSPGTYSYTSSGYKNTGYYESAWLADKTQRSLMKFTAK